MVKKLNWVFLIITVAVCARHLIGLGYFIERNVSYRIKAARREDDFKAQQEHLRTALSDLSGYEERINSLHLLFPSPNLVGVKQLRGDLSWWLDPRLGPETTDLPGQGHQTTAEYFSRWTYDYQVPLLTVMTAEEENYSMYACYIVIPICLLLMLLVFLGPRVE